MDPGRASSTRSVDPRRFERLAGRLARRDRVGRSAWLERPKVASGRRRRRRAGRSAWFERSRSGRLVSRDGRAGPGIPAAGLADLGRERPAERVGDEPGGGQDAVQRDDAVLPARRVEEVDEVLGGEIAGGARRVRAAAGPAGRRSRSSGRRRRGRPRRWPAPSRACRGSGRRSARAGCRPRRPARSAPRPGPARRPRSCRRSRPRRRRGRAAGARPRRRAPGSTRPVYGQPNAVET